MEEKLETIFYFRGTKEARSFLLFLKDERKFDSLSEAIRECVGFVQYLVENNVDPFNYSERKRLAGKD